MFIFMMVPAVYTYGKITIYYSTTIIKDFYTTHDNVSALKKYFIYFKTK